MSDKQRIRDPLHDLIDFDVKNSQLERVLWCVVQTRAFQRLRRIKQLGFSDFVYPGATHSRFLHSLGVFHTARHLIEIIRNLVRPADEAKATQALAAALVHDVGHGPFSHAFESVGKRLKLKMANHEQVSDHLIRNGEIAEILKELGSGFPADVADIVSGSGKKSIYTAVVSSQFDADRLDYMRRDRLMSGTKHAGIDFEWLMANLEVGTLNYGVDDTAVGQVQTFVLGSKAFYAAEAYVLGLFQLYPTVYFHKATRGAEKLYVELLLRVIKLILDGASEKTGLPETHPLLKFARKSDSIEAVLNLDDSTIWGALSLMAEGGSDDCLTSAAKRIRDRALYKCIDVRSCIARKLGDEAVNGQHTDQVCITIGAELEHWSSSKSTGLSRILIDQESRSPYKRFSETKGPLDQIYIKTEGGRLEDLSKRSKVVAASETFKLFRVYYADEDEEAKSEIESVIEARIKSWPH